MTDERRPKSLAADAASWVPPWERAGREPDRDYQTAAASSGDDESDLEGDDDDFDPAFEGEQPELPPLPGETEERAIVDAPTDLDEDADPTDVGVGPDLAVPDAVEQAADEDDEVGGPVDAALIPEEGDDAGDVFDAAADDDVSDDAEVDLPVGPEPSPEPTPEPMPEPAPIPSQARGSQPAEADDEAEDDIPAAPLSDDDLRGALEAVLLVVDEPVVELQLAQVVGEPVERVGPMLEDISARYTAAGHGFDLRRAAGGWRLYTRPEYAAYVERFVLDGQSVRLTQAALETLAVVAYKQPVTRSRISAIRGVNCDGVMRTLATRGLIEEVGTEPET